MNNRTQLGLYETWLKKNYYFLSLSISTVLTFLILLFIIADGKKYNSNLDSIGIFFIGFGAFLLLGNYWDFSHMVNSQGFKVWQQTRKSEAKRFKKFIYIFSILLIIIGMLAVIYSFLN